LLQAAGALKVGSGRGERSEESERSERSEVSEGSGGGPEAGYSWLQIGREAFFVLFSLLSLPSLFSIPRFPHADSNYLEVPIVTFE
jgi:hypothetical protein